MKIEAYPLQSVKTQSALGRIEGQIVLPEGAKIVYIGASPPSGDMMAYAEVSPVNLPDRPIDVVVLKPGDVIPNGYEYLGHILAVPLLFIYRRKENAIIT